MKYVLNLLPSALNYVDEDAETIMEIISDSDELEMFNCKSIQDLIEFKWNKYAKYIHYTGSFFHVSYVIVFFIYVNEVYINRDD
jgi:hypothetical protein